MGWEETSIQEVSSRIRDFLEVEVEVCRDCKQSVKGPFD
jgi:hypothetical protein